MKGGRRDEKGIVIITQEGNKFVGVSLTENGFASNGAEIIKGELEIVGFKTVSTYYKNADWYASTGEIGEKCNKIVIRMKTAGGGVSTLITLTRK
jgi:hypothetical protein